MTNQTLSVLSTKLPAHEFRALKGIAGERIACKDEPIDIAADLAEDFDLDADEVFTALFL